MNPTDCRHYYAGGMCASKDMQSAFCVGEKDCPRLQDNTKLELVMTDAEIKEDREMGKDWRFTEEGNNVR